MAVSYESESTPLVGFPSKKNETSSASTRIPAIIVICIFFGAIALLFTGGTIANNNINNKDNSNSYNYNYRYNYSYNDTNYSNGGHISSMVSALSEVSSSSSDIINKIPFPVVHRADYNDAATGIIPLDLFDSNLLGDNGQFLKIPFPTGAFWTNFIVDPDPDGLSYPIVTYPLAYKWTKLTLQLSYPALRRTTNQISILDTFNPDITFSSMEAVTKRNIVDFDPLTVTLRYYADQTTNYDSYWETYIVHGTPYMTVKYNQMTPVLTMLSTWTQVLCSTGVNYQDATTTDFAHFSTKDLSWSNCATKTSTSNIIMTTPQGVQFMVQTPQMLTLILFFSEPVSLLLDNDRKTNIITTDKWTGILRVAIIPPVSNVIASSTVGIQRLVYHANEYPIGAQLSWKFATDKAKDRDVATIQFQFSTMKMTSITSPPILMLGLPHHAQLLDPATLIHAFDITYLSIKGPMTPVIGSTWSYEESLTAAQITTPSKPMDPQLQHIIMSSVEKDLMIVLPVFSEDIYGYGKQIARLANLAHIASTLTKQQNNENQHYTEIRTDATDKLYLYLRSLLDGNITDHLLYDADLGGIVSTLGLKDSHGDFGNGRYNDHHFHYGYTLYACAILGSINATFVMEYGDKVDHLLQDVASSGDTILFPLARHKSWFDGHSFASGLFPFSDGKSQESSSEAVNCYYGAYLWSTVRQQQIASTNDARNSIDFARLLLATEIRGAKTYWHMIPSSTTSSASSTMTPTTSLYSDMFAQNYMVGNLGMIDAVSSTWFGSDPLYVHMINFLPVTAITYELFDKDYVKVQYDKVIKPIGEVPHAWKGYTLCNQAIIEPNLAWKEAVSLFSGELDSALSKSQVLYWISLHEDFVFVTDENKDKSNDNTESLAHCESHDGCISLGLTGLCCPTAGGLRLGCCDLSGSKSTGKSINTGSTSCDSNAKCASLGLSGSCCPTSFGVLLECCN